MTLGYSTNAFTKFALDESFEKICDLGFAGVEIMCDRPHLYPPEYDDAALAQMKEKLDGLGLKVTNLNSFTLFAVGDTYLPSWIEPEAERRQIRIQHTINSLHVARKLGARNISVPPGGPLEKNQTRAEAFRFFYQGLEQVIPLAEEIGVKILVEPEPDLLIERTSEFLPFIREIQSPAVGINFDIGHFFCAGEDPAAAFQQLAAWVGHVHIEDIAPSRVHNHLIAGQGAIDFEKVLAVMVQCGYEGDISLELYPYVDRPEEAGRESLTYLAPIFEKVGMGV